MDDDQMFASDLDLPLVLSRQHATRRNLRKKDGAVRTYSYLPKVVGNSISRKDKNKRQGGKLGSETNSTSPNSIYSNIFLPSTAEEQCLSKRACVPRKTPVNLPKLAKKHEDDCDPDVKDGVVRRRKGVAPLERNRSKRNANTVQLPTASSDEQNPGLTNGFPRRATTTATGKSHLIGPMNKLDMIAYYSRAMQERLITYDEFIKKLSVLSLHKVAMPNSSLRHFQIVR